MLNVLKVIARTLLGLAIMTIVSTIALAIIVGIIIVIEAVGLEAIVYLILGAVGGGFLLSISYDIGKGFIK